MVMRSKVIPVFHSTIPFNLFLTAIITLGYPSGNPISAVNSVGYSPSWTTLAYTENLIVWNSLYTYTHALHLSESLLCWDIVSSIWKSLQMMEMDLRKWPHVEETADSLYVVHLTKLILCVEPHGVGGPDMLHMWCQTNQTIQPWPDQPYWFQCPCNII